MKKSHIIPALLILSCGILLLAWDIFSGVFTPTKGIALILASVGYLLIRKRIPSNLKMATSPGLLGKSSVSLILNILFLIAFSYTLITVATSKVYSIPITYFISTVVMCLIITLDIISMPSEKTAYTKIILLKIIVLSLLLIWIPYYKFPNTGVDPWYHIQFIRDVLRESHIPSIGHQYYKDFAAMHLIVAGVKTITGLAIKNSMMFIGVIGVVSLLSTFCLGKILFNEKVGLLAALFLGFSNDFIYWGYYIIPMSLGVSITIVLIYLIIKAATTSRKLPFMFLSLLLLSVLIYTHTIASFVFLIIIMSMHLGEWLIRLWAKERSPAFLSYTTSLLFGVAMIAYWLYVAGYFFRDIVTNLARVFPLLTSEFEYSAVPVDITLSVLNSLGFTFLIGLGAVAILYCWEHREIYRTSLMLITAGLGLAIALYAAFFSGQAELLLPDRWEVFILVPLTMLAAWGIFLIYHSLRGKLLKILSLGLMVLIISFTMISTSLFGHSNPLIDKGSSGRGFFFNSETMAADTISNSYDGVVISDIVYTSYFANTYNKEIGSIYNSFIVRDEPEINGAILVRNYILNYVFRARKPEEEIKVYSSYSVLLNKAQKDKVESLDEDPGYNKIYSNNEVVAYVPYSMKKAE